MEKGVNIKNHIKRIFILLMTFVTIFSSVPIVSFSATADDDDDEKLPALVPAVANSIISKYVKTNINANSSSSGNANNNSSSSNQSSTNNQNSSSSNNSSTGTGTARIDDSYNLNNDGYSTIFTSGTTGRQFKEYKQNIPGWDSRYPISCYAATNRDWTGECGLVSTIIIGSGYSSDATFQSATDNMRSTNRKYYD